jgi:hypothetical protein
LFERPLALKLLGKLWICTEYRLLGISTVLLAFASHHNSHHLFLSNIHLPCRAEDIQARPSGAFRFPLLGFYDRTAWYFKK